MRSSFLRLLSTGLLLASTAALPAQPADAPPPAYAVRMLGSSSVAELMGPVIADFLKAEGWTEVAQKPAKEGGAYYVLGRAPGEAKLSAVYLEPSDPETSIAALGQGFADIAMSGRRATEAEAGKLTSVGNLRSPECEYPIAVDGLAIIVHPTNPIDSLSAGQLKSIFARRTTKWEDVGAAGAIHLYVRDDKSGANQTFQAAIMGDDAIATEAMRYSTHKETAKAVGEDPRGIGFVALPYVGKNKILALVGTDPSKASRPTAAELQAATYPLTRKLYLYTAAAPSNPLIAKLVKFASGPAGDALVVRAGYISPKAPAPTAPPVVTAAPTTAPEVTAKPTPTPRPRPTARPARDRDEDDAPAAKPAPKPTVAPTPAPAAPTPTKRPSRYLP